MTAIFNRELEKYIELTTRIRKLSAPQVSATKSAEEYRAVLLRSFTEIGELSKINEEILRKDFYPLLAPGRDLSDEDVRVIREFSRELIDPVEMENLDLSMFYNQSKRLLEHARTTDNIRIRLIALDNVVMSAYTMLNITLKLHPEYDIYREYRDVGIAAAYEIIENLEPEKFALLPDDETKEIVLINCRYISCLFDWNDLPQDEFEKRAARDLDELERALALSDDPFYIENAPNYNWKYHKFRTLQYIVSSVEFRDHSRFPREHYERICKYSRELKRFLNEEFPEQIEECTPVIQELYIIRSDYLAGHIELEEYKNGLRDLFARRDLTKTSSWGAFPNFTVPYEYMLVLDEDNMTAADEDLLREFYRDIVEYIHRIPKVGILSFILSFMSVILRNYIEVPGGPNLEEMCLRLMAALHPPTYVHTLGVADLTAALAAHAVDKCPENLIGMLGTESVDEVREKKQEILEFARHGGLVHDVGKLFITETIVTYGRTLFRSEFDLIETHPLVGAGLLGKYPETKPYVNMALGHHKWYNDEEGYPSEFCMKDCPEKGMVQILTVADCLDASTDSVGRSYKEGKTVDQFLEELEAGRGTRYAPFCCDLLKDEEVLADVRSILEQSREANYMKTYELLKSL